MLAVRCTGQFGSTMSERMLENCRHSSSSIMAMPDSAISIELSSISGIAFKIEMWFCVSTATKA